MIERHRLKDAQWERIAPLVPGKEGDPGRHGKDNRGDRGPSEGEGRGASQKIAAGAQASPHRNRDR